MWPDGVADTKTEWTKEDEGKFWEACGLSCNRQPDGTLIWHDADGHYVCFGYPAFTLDNLFKRAVPKVNELGYFIELNQDYPYWECIIEGGNDEMYSNAKMGKSEEVSPALALRDALWQVLKKEER